MDRLLSSKRPRCLQVPTTRGCLPDSLTGEYGPNVVWDVVFSFSSQLLSLPSIQGILLKGTPNATPVSWVPYLGQETLIHPLLQSLLGMQHLPGISVLCLGPLYLSLNELSNSLPYFIKVTLEEMLEIPSLRWRPGVELLGHPSWQEWKQGTLMNSNIPKAAAWGPLDGAQPTGIF